MNNQRIYLASIALTTLTSLGVTINHATAAPQASATNKTMASYFVSDAELFANLDYVANPALTPVKKAVDAGNIPAAKKAFADYLRARSTEVTPVVDRGKVAWDPKAADDAAKGLVKVVTIPRQYPNGEIDWRYNATGGTTGLPQNNEWTWQLNRMEGWRELSRAYQATGDD
ncbi:MAG: hypothetical protein EON58_14965, partial [Alphaproteobacteria bacterium]